VQGAWGTTWYVCKNVDASNHIKYSTTSFAHCTSSGTATADISQLRFIPLVTGDTVILDGGPVGGTGITYIGTDLDSAANIVLGQNITLRGPKPTDSGVSGYTDSGGPVTIDGFGFGDDTVAPTEGATIENITISNSPTNYYGVLQITGKTYVYNDVTFSGNWIHVNGLGTATHTRSILKNAVQKGIISNNVSAITTLNYSEISGSGNAAILSYSGTITGNDLRITNNVDGVVYSGNNSQVVVLNNSQIINSASTYSFDSTGSTNDTSTCNNCYILNKPMTTSTAISSGVTCNNCVTDYPPGFVSPKRPGIISFVVDDQASATNFVAVADLASTYGFKITWSVDTTNMTAGNWTTANTYVGLGHEIASHSKTHANLTTSCPTTGLEADCVDEVTGSKGVIESNILGYTVRSMFAPGSVTSAVVRTAASNAGYSGMGVGQTGSSTYLFSSLSKYHVYRNPPGNLLGLKSASPTESQIRSRMSSICEYLNANGGWITFMLHDNGDNGGDSDMDPTNLAYVFDTLKRSNIQVMTFGDAMAYVVANAESTTGSGGELAYVRTAYTGFPAADYRLKPGSPLINNGVVVTGLHDQSTCLDGVGGSCYTQRPTIGYIQTQRPGYLLGIGAGFQLSE
jgi:hypothetical protein